MTVVVVVGLAGLVLASLPFWLPGAVVALRNRIFAWINGPEGVRVEPAKFLAVYRDPGADGRSRGAALSDLFWYWLAPGPHAHQEHIEPGERYTDVARTTRRILAAGHHDAPRLAAECAARVLDGLAGRPVTAVRLRDLMMPVWAEFYYELVFGKPCPPAARDLIVGNANDVASALKCTSLRHMRRRNRLTAYLREHLAEVAHPLPASLSFEDKVFYLQGAFFNTAVVQSSEGMAHLLMVLARHPSTQARVRAEPDFLGPVMEEALRMYPLFGIAHRITTADITVDELSIPRGSVVLFDYPSFHRSGFPHAHRFEPDRWASLSTSDVHHVPFGVTQNRACPARGLVPVTMRAVTFEVLRRFDVRTSAAHTRSMPNRGPALLVRPGYRPTVRLGLMRVLDRWADVPRSVTQLVFGTYMVWDARRKRLCQRYFEAGGV
jgi:cytochrome P450